MGRGEKSRKMSDLDLRRFNATPDMTLRNSLLWNGGVSPFPFHFNFILDPSAIPLSFQNSGKAHRNRMI